MISKLTNILITAMWHLCYGFVIQNKREEEKSNFPFELFFISKIKYRYWTSNTISNCDSTTGEINKGTMLDNQTPNTIYDKSGFSITALIDKACLSFHEYYMEKGNSNVIITLIYEKLICKVTVVKNRIISRAMSAHLLKHMENGLSASTLMKFYGIEMEQNVNASTEYLKQNKMFIEEINTKAFKKKHTCWPTRIKTPALNKIKSGIDTALKTAILRVNKLVVPSVACLHNHQISMAEECNQSTIGYINNLLISGINNHSKGKKQTEFLNHSMFNTSYSYNSGFSHKISRINIVLTHLTSEVNKLGVKKSADIRNCQTVLQNAISQHYLINNDIYLATKDAQLIIFDNIDLSRTNGNHPKNSDHCLTAKCKQFGAIHKNINNSLSATVADSSNINEPKIVIMKIVLQPFNVFSKLNNAIEISGKSGALYTKLQHWKIKLLMKIIKLSVNTVFNDNDIIRFWGETVYAKQTLTNRWSNDVENIKGLKKQCSFALSRYSEALYFKNKKSTILATQNTETKMQLFNVIH